MTTYINVGNNNKEVIVEDTDNGIFVYSLESDKEVTIEGVCIPNVENYKDFDTYWAAFEAFALWLDDYLSIENIEFN